MLAKKIECQKTLNLLYSLIDASNPQEKAEWYFEGDDLFSVHERRRGIPLGNLTSQFFGNLYLSRFDHYVKEVLHIKGYVRYVDDMLFFGKSKEGLEGLVKSIAALLRSFRLKLHENKIGLLKCEEGFAFLGNKIFPSHFRVLSKNIRFARKNLNSAKCEYNGGKVTLEKTKNRIFGIVGFLRMGSNYKITESLLAQTVLVKPSAEAVSSQSWR